MNILYLTQYFPPDQGAAQIRAWEMAKNLTRLGHRVTILTEFPNHPRGVIPRKYRFSLFAREICGGVEVVRSYVKASPKKGFLGRMIFYLSFTATSIFAALKLKRKYDLVYATSSPLFVGLSGYVIAKAKGAKFVLEIRDIWPDAAVLLGQLKNKLFISMAASMEKFCYDKCSKVIVVTEGYRQNLLEKGVSSIKIEVVYNGSNIHLFKPARDGDTLKKRYGFGDRFVVLYAGNLGLIHGMNYLVEAARLLGNLDSIRFLFIGEGPLKKEVMSLRERYQLRNLEVLNGVPAEKIVDYFNLADVCLVSTKKSALTATILPVKMFDAWACAKPIILSVDGEAKDHLRRANAGLWAEPEDPAAIANAIKRLLDNPRLCGELGVNGRKYVEKYFSRKTQAERLERILVDVLTGG